MGIIRHYSKRNGSCREPYYKLQVRKKKDRTDDVIDLSADIAEFENYEAFTRVGLVHDSHHLVLMNAMPTLQKKALKN